MLGRRDDASDPATAPSRMILVEPQTDLRHEPQPIPAAAPQPLHAAPPEPPEEAAESIDRRFLADALRSGEPTLPLPAAAAAATSRPL